MNSHFQSSDTTCTVSGFAEEAIGFGGSRSWELTQHKLPSKNTVIAGTDHTIISTRPE